MNATQLPSEIQTSLLNQIYPSKYGQRKKGFFRKRTKPYSISDIQRTHKDAMKWFTMIAMQTKIDTAWVAMMLTVIKNNKLFGIFAYGNGDTAWYSFKNKKVYDFNHELGVFNSDRPLKGNVYDKQLHRAVPYKQWANEVLSEKRYDAFKGPKSWQKKVRS